MNKNDDVMEIDLLKLFKALWKRALVILLVAVLLAATLIIEAAKRSAGIDPMVNGGLPWFVDLAPYAAALMLLGAWCGEKRIFEKLNAKNILIGLVLLAASEVLNQLFWGSARTSVVQYIAGGAWYGVLTAFDKVIGLERLKAVHINDSKNPLGARKDRHEKIGEGTIGTEGILRVMRHEALRELPFYLETPNELDGYEREIRMLKELY